MFPERGLVELADAIASSPELPARLVVAGPGDGDTLDQLRAQSDPRVVVLDASPETRRQVLAGVDVYVLPGLDCAGDLTHNAALQYGAPVLHQADSSPDGVPEGASVPVCEDESLTEALARIAASPPGPEATVAALGADKPWHAAAQRIRRLYLEPVP